jgi:hypothetical protein
MSLSVKYTILRLFVYLISCSRVLVCSKTLVLVTDHDRRKRGQNFGLKCHSVKSSPFVYSKERNIMSCAMELGNQRLLAILIDSGNFEVDLPSNEG